MARLIDADKLIEAMESNYPTKHLLAVREIKTICGVEIKEAIPIEWIEKRISTYILFYEEKKKREPEIARLLAQGISEMSELIDDWRAENEPY